MIVDRAPVVRCPAEDEDLVVGPGMDDRPAITRVIESDSFGQVAACTGEALKSRDQL